MSFAALQTRMNATAVKRLGQAVVLAGVTVLAKFDKRFVGSTIGDSGIASTQSVLTLQSTDVPPQIVDWFNYFSEPFNPLDLLVTVDGDNFKIVAHEPTGSGLSRLILEAA